MAGVPEGFIMPTMGPSLGAGVIKAMPSAEAISGAVGTMLAEIKRHKEFNSKRTQELVDANLPGEMSDEIELVLFTTDKFSKTPLRASCLSDPGRKFYNELSTQQQIQLAELRERFRKNEHGGDTPISLWDALSTTERGQLVAMGILYVEQLAAYQEHEVYKLGNGGAEWVKRAQRHVAGKVPNKQEEFEKQMASLLSEKAAERERADDMERKYFEMQKQIAELTESKAKTKAPKTAGVQEG